MTIIKMDKVAFWNQALVHFFAGLVRRQIPERHVQYYEILRSPSAYRAYGWFRRDLPRKSRVYFLRLAKEFHLIEEKNFWPVFEQVQQILCWMEEITKHGIPHVVRGSSGSSLTCYLLGITSFDPIEHDISLARFMHSFREDLPDIDIDVPAHLRIKLYQRIFQEWHGRVARISNHLYYRPKSALRQAIRQAGDWHHHIPKNPSLDDLFPDQHKKQRQILELTEELIDTFRGYSLHCGGIVVFPEQVPEHYVLGEWDMGDGKRGCQVHLDKNEIETEKLIKIDLLSNRGLSILCELSPGKSLDQYSLNCQETWELLCRGETIGVTYAETPAMRKVLQGLQPKKLADLACGLALIRPAASGCGQKVAYLRYHMDNQEDDECPFRGEERPWIIYDDDAIQWIQKWLQCSEADADGYRKAFAKNQRERKQDFEHELRRLHRDEWTEEQIRWILAHLEQLQDYSFCKSHAYSYAQLVYALAWEKVHHPVQFWEACLKHSHSSYRKWVYVREAVAAGAQPPPDIPPKNVPNKITSYFGEKKQERTEWTDFYKMGYWWSPNFLPGCGVQWENGQGVKGRVSFRGIVATGRIYLPDRKMKPVTANVNDWPEERMEGQTVTVKTGRSRWITFVTLGVGNQEYLDIVLWGRYAINHIRIIEGWGEWDQWVTVHKVKVLQNITSNQEQLPTWNTIPTRRHSPNQPKNSQK